MDLRELMNIAQAFANMGSSIQEQAFDILNYNEDECNANAVREVQRWAKNARRSADDDSTLASDLDALLERIEERLS